MTIPRPNILFILADQQRTDTMGCYGQRLPITPNLDRIASEGVLFENAFTCQPVCGPARSCLQSGLYATATGCYRNNVILPPGQPTIAKQITASGYRTAYVGKWHLASDATQNNRMGPIPSELRGGYDDYVRMADCLEFTSHGYEGYFFDQDNHRMDWEGYRVDKTTDYVLDFFREYQDAGSEEPFFAFVSYIEPHQQNDLDRYIGPIGSKQRFADYDVPGDLQGTEGDWRKHYPDYLGCCWSLDQNIGRLRADLDLRGLWDNTLVIYTADHSCHFRTRNAEYKRSCHDNSINVPLIMKGPAGSGFEGGQRAKDVVSLIDLPPTVLDVAGAAPLPDAHGRSVAPLVRGEATDWQQDVLVQISEDTTGRAVRTQRWTYAVTHAFAQGASRDIPAADTYTESHLFDNDSDPFQKHNLVADAAHAEVRKELRGRLLARLTQAGEATPQILTAAGDAV